MQIAELRLACTPSEKTSANIYLQHYWANEETGLGDGDDRGDLLGVLYEYALTQDVSTHLLFEWFNPDDFYQDDADEAYFARWNMLVKF